MIKVQKGDAGPPLWSVTKVASGFLKGELRGKGGLAPCLVVCLLRDGCLRGGCLSNPKLHVQDSHYNQISLLAGTCTTVHSLYPQETDQ